MIRSAVRLPMPGHGLEARGVAGGDGGQQLARRAAGEHGERHLRADALDADQQQEQVALLLGGEAVELQRVVAHDQVGVQRGRLARRAGTLAQRLGRDREPVADAAAGDDDVVGRGGPRPRRETSAITPRALASAACSGAPLAWQIATASASAAWSGCGSSASESSVCDHPLHLVLAGAAGAADRALDLLRRVGAARDAALAGGEQHDAARLADRERGARVGAEVEVLDRDRVGPVLVDQLADARVDRRPAARSSGAPGARLDHAAVERDQPPAAACATTP